jgi:hypothetical protein
LVDVSDVSSTLKTQFVVSDASPEGYAESADGAREQPAGKPASSTFCMTDACGRLVATMFRTSEQPPTVWIGSKRTPALAQGSAFREAKHDNPTESR